MAENIVGKLYGAPYFENYVTGPEFKYRSYYQTINIEDINNFTNSLRSIVDKRILDLTKEEEKAKSQMRATADKVKNETLELFGRDERLLDAYLKAANSPEQLKVEEKLLELATLIVDEAVKRQKRIGKSGGKLNLTDRQVQNIYKVESIKKIFKEATDLLSETLSLEDKDRLAVIQAMQNLITKSFFQPQDEDALVLYANRKGGTIGEIAALLGVATNSYVSQSTEELIKNLEQRIKGIGGGGIKPDITYLDMSFSVKNYKNVKNTNKNRINNYYTKSFLIHQGVTPDKLLQEIQDSIDPEFLKDNPSIQKLTISWMNMIYLYNYGYKDEDREIRNIFNRLLRCYGIAYLVGGTSVKKSNQNTTYLEQVSNILGGNPAYFFYFPAIGVIPMYSILEEIANAAENNISNDFDFKISFSSKTAASIVDAQIGHGDNAGRKINNNVYYNSLFWSGKGQLNKREVDNLLNQRYQTFTQNLSTTSIELHIQGASLENLLSKSGVKIP